FSPRLQGDPRATLIEGQNARDLDASHLDGVRPGFIVCDASFISLKLVLPAALALAAPEAQGVFLIKPQFEAGRERIGKNGIVGPDVAEAVAADLLGWLGSVPGWRAVGITPSPIAG